MPRETGALLASLGYWPDVLYSEDASHIFFMICSHCPLFCFKLYSHCATNVHMMENSIRAKKIDVNARKRLHNLTFVRFWTYWILAALSYLLITSHKNADMKTKILRVIEVEKDWSYLESFLN